MKRTDRILTTFKRFFVLTVIAIVGNLSAFSEWDGNTVPGSIVEAGITGTGTSGDPYVIHDELGFVYFGTVIQAGGNTNYWSVDCPGDEIDLGGNEWKFGSVGGDGDGNYKKFAGNFNGNGVTVKNFKLNTNDFCNVGLFNCITGTVSRLFISNVTLTDGNKWNSCNYGILAAVVSDGTVSTCKVTNSSMSFNSKMQQWGSIIGIGGIAGKVVGNGVITNSKVETLSITSNNTSVAATNVYIGGVVGNVASTSNLNRCAAKGVNIKTPFYRGEDAQYTGYSVGHLSAGGVIGNVTQPCAGMPEDLCAYNCKIYCPQGSVGPVCGMFIKSTGTSDQTVSDDYSAENGSVSTANRNKTASWMYNGYKLGISDAVANPGLRYKRNYSAALVAEDGVNYLDVQDAANTLPKTNRVTGSARQSRTVLWYTQNNGSEASSDTEQGIYPRYGDMWGATFPGFYSYFMQGYNVGTYVSSTQADDFVESIAGVKKLAKITLVDNNLGQRGTGAHVIEATIVAGADDPLPLKWYIDGVEQTGVTGYTCSAIPKYNATVTVSVTAADGASSSYLLSKAYLPTKNCPHLTDDEGHTIPARMTTQQGTILDDNDTRGSANNPYVITSEEELRLWSELSRMTGTIENGIDRNGQPIMDGADHFNTSHFLLETDVEFDTALSDNLDGLTENKAFLNTDGRTYTYKNYTNAQYRLRHGFNPAYTFDPICGFTSDEIYDREHTFRGTFDGQAHVIKGLRQLWRGGTLNTTYAERATMNWGLFGCVGGDKNNPAVIKNVIIEDAKFEHDVYNGSFMYYSAMNCKARYTDSRGTSVAVGVVAGMVTNYSTVTNIDVKKCAIYASCVDVNVACNNYSLIDLSSGSGAYHLWIGGAIGRTQADYETQRGDIAGTISINKISVNVDLDVFPVRPKGTGWSALPYPDDGYNTKAKRFMSNMGGIVGSMYSSGGWTSLPWPEQAFFTGQMRAMCTISGPIFGFVNYGSMTENITTYQSIHQHWIGQPGAIKSGYYNNYFLRHTRGDEVDKESQPAQMTGKGEMRSHATAGMIWESQANAAANQNAVITNDLVRDGGRYGQDGKLFYLGPITPTSPDKPLHSCTLSEYSGARSILKHEDNSLTGNDDIAGRFQGINQGIWKDWESEANQTAVVDEFDKRPYEAKYTWAWDPETGRPILTSVAAEHLDADTVKGDPSKLEASLKVDEALEAYTYAWYDACGSQVQSFAVAGGTSNGEILDISSLPGGYPTTYDRFFYAVAKKGTEGTDDYKFFKSDIVKVPGTLQPKDFKAELVPSTEDIASSTYTRHQDYLGVRISQKDYYELPENIRQKEAASYYPCKDQDDCFNKWLPDYEGSLVSVVYDEDGQKYVTHYEEWNTDYTPKPIYVDGVITNKDAIWTAYQNHFNNAPGVDATPKSDPTSLEMLLRIPATYYSYAEFIGLDQQQTDTYDENSTPYSGYVYKFNDDASDPRAGMSYVNRTVTKSDFDNLPASAKTIPAVKRTTLSVVLTPSESSLDDKYIVSYQWYTLDGEKLEGEDRSELIVDNNPDLDRGSYLCRVVVSDDHNCNGGVLLNVELSKTWGTKYIYINPTSGTSIEYSDSERSGTCGEGKDTNDGLTPETPVKSWPRAYELLKEGGTWEENQIILIGESPVESTNEGFGLGTENGNGNNRTGIYDVWYQRAQNKFMTRNATISSRRRTGAKFGGKLIMGNCSANQPQLALFGDTRFENMKIGHVNQGSGYGIIACQYYNLEMGDSLEFEGYPSASSASAEVGPLQGTQIADLQIFGGCNNDNRFLQMPGSISNFEATQYIPHPEGFTITVKSGFYSNICASGRQSTDTDLNGIVGTPNRPVKCKIIVDIDRGFNDAHNHYGASNASYDVGAVMAGNHEGAQYGDVDIVIRSGIVGRVTSGSLGNKRKATSFGTTASVGFSAYKSYYGTKNTTDKNVYQPFDTYFGRCNILVDPKSSKMNKNEDIDARVVISEIYGGALGRHMGNSTDRGVCMSTFYGKTNITINGGTFDLNSPEGNTSWDGTAGTESGKYGLAAYKNGRYTVNSKYYYRSQPGIYAAGAGGFNGIGSDELHTNDLRLPYWSTNITDIPVNSTQGYNKADLRAKGVVNPDKVVFYGDYDEYKKHTGDDKVYITVIDSIVNIAGKDSVYTSKIDPAETSTTITINGGNFFPRELPQGAGIYGAGNGYVNNKLIDYPRQAPNPLGGSLLGKPGTTAMEMNINGGTFNCEIFGGGRGNDIYYNAGLHYYGSEGTSSDYSGVANGVYTTTNTSDKNYESYGVTLDNFSRNARVLGNVVMNINGGVFKQNIYGSGSGSNTLGCEGMAEVIGTTTINVDSTAAKIYGDIFGGGNYARTRVGTEVNINAGYVYGSVFGGGNQATVGTIGTKTVYPADQVYSLADNVATEGWSNEDAEEKGVIHDASGNEHAIGDPKPGATGTDVPVGTGRTSVYTRTSSAYVYGDIYGGGNKADVNGDTYVGMSAGHIAGNIYGGGNGVYGNSGNAQANVHGFTEVFLNGYTVMWDYMFNTSDWTAKSYNERVAMTEEQIRNEYLKSWTNNKTQFVRTETVDGKTRSYWYDRFGDYNAHNIFGGGNIYCDVDSTARVTVTRGMTPKALLEQDEWKQSYYDNNTPHFYVFGGGNGPHTNVKNTYVNVGMEGVLTQDATADFDDVLAKPSSMFVDEDGNDVKVNNAGDDNHNVGIFSNGYGIADYTVLGVLGGGMEGQVQNNTDVTIGGNTFIHRVYGGGYGKRDRTVTDKMPENTTLGYVGHDTRVTANGGLIYGDIFGGGARGDVGNTTYVQVLRDCKVYGSVYGGGDVAKVNSVKANDDDYVNDTVSTVVIGGGNVYRNVFAGGSQGPVYGSTLVNVVDSTMFGKKVIPNIYHDIYGGGEKADIYGNANVLIEGGNMAGDIFGGGLGIYVAGKNDSIISADIKQHTNVAINGGSALWSQMCDDWEQGHIVNFDNSAKIPMSRFKAGELTADDVKGTYGTYDWTTSHFVVNHNVYGGGNINCQVAKDANVTMNHGLVTEGLQYYDKDEISLFAICWYNAIQNKAYPQFSVLGGGYGEHTTVGGNTNVEMNVANYMGIGFDLSGDSLEYKAYKNYKAYNEDLAQYRAFETELMSRWSAFDDPTKVELYGGTNNNVYRRYRASRYAWSGGVHGHVMASVYGGSWAGKVVGNANVMINGTSGCRNVFGGGVGLPSDEKLGELGGSATVTINGAIVSGSVFGGGAGVESADTDGDDVIDKDYYNVARVVNSAKVVVNSTLDNKNEKFPADGTIIFGSVVGGGDVASVGAYQSNYNNIPVQAETADQVYTTDVEINGGLVFSPIYAGGSGRVKSLAADYTRLGAVYGHSRVKVNTVATDVNSPWLWNSVYGGGMSGTVFGSSYVNVAGGNFGYDIFGGGFGNADGDNSTDAAVKGNTHVDIDGGEWCISQKWVITDEEGNDVRAWAPVNHYLTKTYSAQYDPENLRFIVDHNIYGGGHACSTVSGDTYVNMTKGMLRSNTPLGRSDFDPSTGNIFSELEWKESYDKVGSAHFSVFGAGYGELTTVENTHVNIDIDGDVTPNSQYQHPAQGDAVPYYQRFESLQSLLDVIGGGYNGMTNGATYVHVGGKTFMRRLFTGGYYAPVRETNALVTSGDIDEVFGGGLIGDVYENTNVQIGIRENSQVFDNVTYNETNSTLFINKNIYGGNDVSGTIGYENEVHEEGQGTHVNLHGGTLYGDVYGGGNGNYLYALGVNGEKKVTPNEHYLKRAGFEGYDLVYTVPMRDGMISSSVASDAQKIVNIASYRPSTIEANIKLWGKGVDNKLIIEGNVFGGGNAATVDGIVSANGENSAKVNFDIKDYINVGGVYLGSDGDAMFLDSSSNPFLSNFQTINNINLEDTVIWDTDPANHGIKEKYLAVKNEDRPLVYPHLLDLYFQPVEMSVQPTVLWNGEETGDVTDATIGIFCCGGNRGNMNVYPVASGDNEGNVVDIKFPDNLVITDRIIGGCNNANYVWHNTNTGNNTTHVGGYLLGERKSKNPMIRLLVKNKFQPSVVEMITDGVSHKEYQGGNVYGGCYRSGNIIGDVTVDLRSNMLKGLRSEYFANISDIGASACNVYGAGYGTNSYVYGDTKVIIGAETVCKTKVDSLTESSGAKPAFGGAVNAAGDKYEVYDDLGTSANYVFGGGLQGNVVGNANVRYLNGHTLHSVTGGSYAGYLWGSTQVLVGYPDYYTVKAGKQGVYAVKRKDESADNLAQTTTNIKGNTEDVIKQEIYLMAGDIIAPTLYESIIDADPTLAVGESKEAFAKTETAPANWENIDITIGEAVYGGGYSLASGSSVMANNTIVLKYDAQHNTDDETTTKTSVGYGGNTTMVVWDKITYTNGVADIPGENDVDHITISQQEMTEVDLPHGTDLFGYYYKDTYGHYHYIYEENKYFQGLEYPKPPLFVGTYVSAYDFEAEGGLYGDGHLSFSEGFRTGEIKGYGFNGGRTIEGARLMNSFQRMDILRVEDCNVIMLGARDYATNVTNTTPYSMSRIGELQMISHIDDRGALQPVSNITMEQAVHGQKAARNFLGLSNNILYVGCIYTNTPFTDTWHDYDNTIGDMSYQAKKQSYIDAFYPEKTDNSTFQKRNDATAKNMIGVSSGYALKIQNVTSRYVVMANLEGEESKEQKDSVFYGPIVGVAEVNLMSSRLDEGGGYIYADNIHKRPANDDPKTEEDFLMTTGNFVFPHNDAGRYILDDCYVKTYDETLGAGGEAEEAHYWYIEGYNYFYNIHITGYTSDSRNEPLKFDSDNTDLLTIMKGAKAGQKVTLHSIRWRSEHMGEDDKSYDECDIDGSYKATGAGYPASMTAGAATYGNETLNQRWNDNYYKLRLSASCDTTLEYRDKVQINDELKTPAHGDLQRATNMTTATELTGELLTDEPVIAMQLVDAVDNTTEAYYNRHLSRTCKATVVLTVPALDENGQRELGYTTIAKKEIYKTANHVGLEDKVEENYVFDMTGNTKYYYFNDNTHEYNEIDMTKLKYRWGTGISDDNYRLIKTLRTNEDGLYVVTYDDTNGEVTATATNIFLYDYRDYTYTLYLSIDYVQGPEVRGHIDIENCALPGEMVRLTTKNVKISADDSMAPVGYYWRIGMRKQDESGHWHFIDDTKWTPTTATTKPAAGYDSYKQNGEIQRGVFKGCVYDETDGYLEVPVYYFMNGYGVQFGIEFNGLEGKIFPVNMATADSLLVHNYHRMATHAPKNESLHLHLSEALARVQAREMYLDSLKAWNEFKALDEAAQNAVTDKPIEPVYVAPLNQPRIYLADDADLHDFYCFIDSVGRYDKNKWQKNVRLGNPNGVYPVPTGGKYAQFYVLENIAFHDEFYHTPREEFEGLFDGLGHTIDMTNITRVTDANAPTLLNGVAGHVYNLGVVGKPLAASVAADDTSHIHNCFVYGMKNNIGVRMLSGSVTKANAGLDNCYDLTNAADEDFRYGKVAYNLNRYYLEERFRRGSETAAVNNDRIEQYFSNEDFQYARRADFRTGNVTGVAYLRIGNDDLPAYGSSSTRHMMSHGIDAARGEIVPMTEAEATAKNRIYNEEYAYEIEENSGSPRVLTADPYTTQSISHVKYHALFNQAAYNKLPGVVEAATDSLRNDYILFGQNLTATADSIPAAIKSCVNTDAANRVWRASGFYGTKKDEGFFHNAMTNMATTVLDPRLTAIDFTCFRDSDAVNHVGVSKTSYRRGMNTSTVTGEATDMQDVAYAPVADMPDEASYWKFTVGNSKVTQNLLVYTASGNNNISKKVGDETDGVGYKADRPEADIKGHQVVMSKTNNIAALLHLVDKENFNAPIAFTASSAWYDRVPKNETGFVENAGQGWASICLPYTVKKTSLSIPIERFYDYADEKANPSHVRNTKKCDQDTITYFFGAGDTNENPNIINHEYWLRAMDKVDASNGVRAHFKRPLLSLDGNKCPDNNYEGDDDGGGFAAYNPFIVSFPGEKFYEFNMNTEDDEGNPQKITFSAINAFVAVTSDSIVKAVQTINNGTRDYIHYGAMMNDANESSDDLKYAIALNDESEENTGELFKVATPIYPFRSYIVNAAHVDAGNGAKASSFSDLSYDQPEVIYIEGLGISLEDKGIEEPETEDVIEFNGMRIYPASGRRIVVESTYATTVNVYSASGQLVRVLDVRPGTSIYSGFTSGVHVVEQKKMMLK